MLGLYLIFSPSNLLDDFSPLFQCLSTLSEKKFFPNIQPEDSVHLTSVTVMQLSAEKDLYSHGTSPSLWYAVDK